MIIYHAFFIYKLLTTSPLERLPSKESHGSSISSFITPLWDWIRWGGQDKTSRTWVKLR